MLMVKKPKNPNFEPLRFIAYQAKVPNFHYGMKEIHHKFHADDRKTEELANVHYAAKIPKFCKIFCWKHCWTSDAIYNEINGFLSHWFFKNFFNTLVLAWNYPTMQIRIAPSHPASNHEFHQTKNYQFNQQKLTCGQLEPSKLSILLKVGDKITLCGNAIMNFLCFQQRVHPKTALLPSFAV
jgi:hypothetical protein